MVISFENSHRDIQTDDDTLLSERQRFLCMFFEDVFHIRRTAAHLAASGGEGGLADDIVEKLNEIIGISEEISRMATEETADVIPRSRTDLNDRP